MIFSCLLLPLMVSKKSCQLEELQPHYATKWTTLWRWDPPNTFGVVCFLNQIQFTKCTIDLNHVIY